MSAHTKVAQLSPVLLPTKYRELSPFLDAYQRSLIGAIEKSANSAIDDALAAFLAAQGAQATADLAQSDASLSLSEVSTLSQKNEMDLAEAAFLRHWRIM